MNIEKKFLLSEIRQLTNEGLFLHLAKQAIRSDIGIKYLHQVYISNALTKKHFLAVGMLNEDEGYEVQNAYFSDFIGDRDISFIRGRFIGKRSINVFHHMNDFLAMASRQQCGCLLYDSIILHSFDLLHKVPAYLYQYGYQYLYSWMPNDDYGIIACDTLSAYCLTERGLEHMPMNRFYADHATIQKWCAANIPFIKT